MANEHSGVPGPDGYARIRLVGTGATSRVYRAEREQDGRVCALKRLNRHMVRSTEALARLRRELELLQTLRHPGIVNVYDVIHWDDDPTLVMDHVEGEDLEARIVRDGPLGGNEVEALARGLLDILAVTHSAGIVHRDLKPHNVRLGADGRVTLLDFGSARLDAASRLTATGTTVGTPEYMAPELFAGPAYDPRVDIFGLGATLFEALVGEPPQTADSLAELAWLRTHQEMPRVQERAPTTPAHLARFVDRCLALDPADRYSTASLALWSLDHPEIERSFGAHRSLHPPCLHCDQPLPPRATCCPGCKSDHPFGFSQGSCDVVITGMSAPAVFAHWLCARFPERARDMVGILERCAGLSVSEQQYVCGISRDEATVEVSRLAEIGVNAYVRPAKSRVGGYVGAVACIGLACILPGPGLLGLPLVGGALGLMLVPWWRRMSRASDSFLATAHSGRPLVPGGAAAMGVMSMAWLGYSLLPSAPGALIAAVLGCGSLVALYAHMRWGGQRLQGSRAPRRLSPTRPQPLLFRSSQDFEGPSQGILRGRAPVPAGLVFGAALLLVGLEVTSVYGIYDHMKFTGSPSASITTPYVTPESERRLVTRPTPVSREAETLTPLYVVAGGAFGGPILLSLGILALGRARRRRLDEEVAILEEEVEAIRARFAVNRTPPATRRPPSHLGPGTGIAGLHSADMFAVDAVCRATSLAHFLDPAARERLRAAVEAVIQASGGAEGEREASLLSRCILELDDEGDTRLQFLALEGELEAVAATTWWEERR